MEMSRFQKELPFETNHRISINIIKIKLIKRGSFNRQIQQFQIYEKRYFKFCQEAMRQISAQK